MDISEKRRLNLLAIAVTYSTQKKLAEALDLDPSYVSQLLAEPGSMKGQRNIGPKAARRIESKLGLEPYWLDRTPAVVHDDHGLYNTSPGRVPTQKVPLISAVKAGDADLAIDLLEPGDAEEWVMCNLPHSRSAYALRVEGHSMTAPPGGGKSFPEGIFIYVDPELRGGVIPGDFVVAKLSGRDAVTFKQLAMEDGRLILRPLNPDYKPIFEEFRVLGKVIYAGFRP